MRDSTTCHRCGADIRDVASTMSMFNRDIICWPCVEKEQAHPLFEQACKAERRARARGDKYFVGIGKPLDLTSTYSEET